MPRSYQRLKRKPREGAGTRCACVGPTITLSSHRTPTPNAMSPKHRSRATRGCYRTARNAKTARMMTTTTPRRARRRERPAPRPHHVDDPHSRGARGPDDQRLRGAASRTSEHNVEAAARLEIEDPLAAGPTALVCHGFESMASASDLQDDVLGDPRHARASACRTGVRPTRRASTR